MGKRSCNGCNYVSQFFIYFSGDRLMSKIGDLAIELMELGALVPDRYEPDMASYKGDNESSNTNPKGDIESPLYDEYKERKAGLLNEAGVE